MSLCNSKIFEDVYSRYSDDLFNFLYYTLGDKNKAEDVTQNVFLTLWEECKNVTLEKVKSYLFTLGRNKSLNLIKHDKVVFNFRSEVNNSINLEAPDYQIEYNEYKKLLENTIGELNEGERQVFLMNRIDKKKYTEIAEELGLSVKAVEKRMHNALAHIKAKLDGFNR